MKASGEGILSKGYELSNEKSLELTIVNWQMFKDRIKFFDDIISRLRLEGTPICIAIYTFGYLSNFWLVYLLGIFYVFGILCLDLLHMRLLMTSVDKAKQIESKFENSELSVTTDLESVKRTFIHYFGAGILYGSLIVAGVVLIIIQF